MKGFKMQKKEAIEIATKSLEGIVDFYWEQMNEKKLIMGFEGGYWEYELDDFRRNLLLEKCKKLAEVIRALEKI